MHTLGARVALMGVLVLRQMGIGPHVSPAPKAHASIEQLWLAPTDLPRRDVFAGSAQQAEAPDVRQPMTFVSKKTSGFSPGFDVKDASGHEWSAKLGPEAQTEVVASRILWALGYHQAPTFYVRSWELRGGPSPGVQKGARFRPKDRRLTSDGMWSWQHNPFVETQPYRGLLVLMLMLNSTDLRNGNNVVYKAHGETPDRWYAVKDLGATFGATGVYRPSRNDIDAFEHDPFLVERGKRARLTYKGLQKELLRQLTPADFVWACDRLSELSDAQWRDAFRAGGYSDELTDRYIAALRARMKSARSLSAGFDGNYADYWGARQLRRVGHFFGAIGGIF